jgi:agmatinase
LPDKYIYDKREFIGRNFNGCEAGFDECRAVIFGAPFDGTCSFRPGSRFAPQVMRVESVGMETYSPYQDLDLLEDCRVHDAGDLNLPFGGPGAALNIIYETAARFFRAGKKPLMIGGEHLVTLPMARAAIEKYPDIRFVHFDAHTDLRDEFYGQKLSHASVIRRVWDAVGDGRIFQFGIRSGAKEEFKWAAEGRTALNKYGFTGLEAALEEIGTRPVYLTLDVDVLDPSAMPGTGTPEAGGVTFRELISAVLAVGKLNLAAADIVELAPHIDPTGASAAAACKLAREAAILLGSAG